MKINDRYSVFGKYAEISALSLLLGIVFLLVTIFVRYFLQQPIDGYSHLAFWAAFGGAFWLLSYFNRDGTSIAFKIKVFFLNIFVIIGACWGAVCSTDLSWDGMTVHQEMVIPLSCEWNPILDKKFSEISEKRSLYPELKKGFVAFNPKIPYFLSASIIRATGHYGSGKAITLIYVWVSALLAFSLLSSLNLDRRYVWLLAVVFAFNPVAIYQGFSYRLDGQVAALLGCLVLSMLAIVFDGDWKQWLVFVLSVILISGTKISGLGYSLVFGSFLLLVKLVWSGRFKRLWMVPIGVLLVAILGNFLGHFVGIWTIKKEKPFPYIERIVEALDKQTGHADIDEMNRFSQFAESYFSPVSIRRVSAEKSSFYLGSDISNDFKLWSRTYNGFYQGGFGPFYGLCFASLLLLLIGKMMVGQATKETWLLASFVAIVFFSALLVPNYWARWTPQLWLIPCLSALALLLRNEGRKGTVFRKGLRLFRLNLQTVGGAFFFLLLFNALFVTAGAVDGQRFGRSILNRQFELIAKSGKPAQTDISWIRAPRLWFGQHGIEYENSNHNDIPPYMLLFHTDLRVRLYDEDVVDSVREIQNEIDFSLYKHWSKEILVFE